MIKLNDIHAALEAAIVGRFPDVTVYHDVTPKNFERPSFYVETQPSSFTADSPSTIERHGNFRIVAFENVDEYHNSQVSRLNDVLDQLIAIFAAGYIRVCDRAPHLVLQHGEFLGTDAVAITLELTWSEDLAELAGDETPEADPLELIEIRQN